MDILISSNLERLIYQSCGCDAKKNLALMQSLSKDGKYAITEEMKETLKDFVGGYADEQKTKAKIHDLYEKTGYVIDTHTAVAGAVYDDYKKTTGDGTTTVIASTASPYKFGRSVMTAIDEKYDAVEDFALIDELCKVSGVPVPQAIEDIRSAPVLHDTVCEKDEMEKMVKAFLGIDK